MAIDSYTVIPAAPGYFVIYASEGKLDTGWPAPVIAWRIATERINGELHSQSWPIVPDGEPASNYVALLRADGRVEMLDGLYGSLEEAAASYEAGYASATKAHG